MSLDLQETLAEYVVLLYESKKALFHRPTGVCLAWGVPPHSCHFDTQNFEQHDMTAHMIEAQQSGVDDPDWDDVWTLFTHLSST
jgi:hypothetical protein